MAITVTSPIRPITLASLLFLGCTHASATEFVRPRPLTEYDDVQLAQELNAAIDSLNDRMTQCVGSDSGTASKCFCRYSSEAGVAKAVYEKTLEARPKWKGKILYWKNPKNLTSHNLVIPAIDHQLSTTLQCE